MLRASDIFGLKVKVTGLCHNTRLLPVSETRKHEQLFLAQVDVYGLGLLRQTVYLVCWSVGWSRNELWLDCWADWGGTWHGAWPRPM